MKRSLSYEKSLEEVKKQPEIIKKVKLSHLTNEMFLVALTNNILNVVHLIDIMEQDKELALKAIVANYEILPYIYDYYINDFDFWYTASKLSPYRVILFLNGKKKWKDCMQKIVDEYCNVHSEHVDYSLIVHVVVEGTYKESYVKKWFVHFKEEHLDLLDTEHKIFILEYLPSDLLQNEAVQLKLASMFFGAISYLANYSIEKKDFILHLIQLLRNGPLELNYLSDVVHYIGNHLLNDKDIVYQLFKKFGPTYFELCGFNHKNDKELILRIIENNCSSIYNYISDNLKLDKDIIKLTFKDENLINYRCYPKEILEDELFMLEMTEICPSIYDYLSKSQKTNLKFINCIIKYDKTKYFQLIPISIRNSREVFKILFKYHPDVIQEFGEEIKNDKEYHLLTRGKNDISDSIYDTFLNVDFVWENN